MADVQIKRVYDPPSEDDGYRVLVDRIWPRGLRKEDAHIDEWCKDIAPSAALRKWFAHDPEKWEAFKRTYKAELREKPDKVGQLRERARVARLTLVYAAKDTEHNNAVVLTEVIEQRP